MKIRHAIGFLVMLLLLGSLIEKLWVLQRPDHTEGIVEVVFMQTSRDADCIALCQGEDAVVIDTGEAIDSEHILQRLKERGINNIFFLILSHPDKDHIGSAKEILREIPTRQIIAPIYLKESALLDQVRAEAADQSIPFITSTLSKRYLFKDIAFTVFVPFKRDYEKDNDYSLAVLAKHRDVNMFFAGDAEKKRIGELLQMNLPPVDVYKVAHHGRANSLSASLINVLQPKYAVITAKSGDSAVLEALQESGSEVLYTSSKDIVMVSDGVSMKIKE